MKFLSSEVLLAIFDYLDEKSLFRAICVCKRWALIGRDSLCRRGPPGQWLSVASHRQYHYQIRHLHSPEREEL
jgi:hypothetical protein